LSFAAKPQDPLRLGALRLSTVQDQRGTPYSSPQSSVPGVRVLPSGIRRLDQLLPYGGLPRGRLSQLSGGPSSGKRALALAIGVRALCQGQRAAWIDGHGSFYPLPALEQGTIEQGTIVLEQLLVVRLPKQPPRSVIKATDMLLQTGSALSLVVVDFDVTGPFDPVQPRHRDHHNRMGTSQLARLRHGAEHSGAAVLFITEQRTRATTQQSLGTFISLHLAVQRTSTDRTAMNGARELRVSIVKSKLGQMAQHTRVVFDEPHSVRLDTTV